jgi:hypothetical protein
MTLAGDAYAAVAPARAGRGRGYGFVIATCVIFESIGAPAGCVTAECGRPEERFA